jgi:hypothetical protein
MADFGKMGRSKPGGGTTATAPIRDHGTPKGGSPAAPGKFGPTTPVHPNGAPNNDKNKAK